MTTTSSIEEIFKTVAKIFNPSGEEDQMLQFVEQFLRQHFLLDGASFISNKEHGIYYCREFSVSASNAPAQNQVIPHIFMSSHLDSDHLADSAEDAANITFSTSEDSLENRLHFQMKGQIGMDDKTGVSVILEVLKMLKENEIELMATASSEEITLRKVKITVFFNVEEETGQKGAIRLPIHLIPVNATGIIVDRMSVPPGRQFINRYRSVPLLLPEHEVAFEAKINAAYKRVNPTSTDSITAIESPNCSDSLEFRGRFDAEVVLPRLIEYLSKLSEAQEGQNTSSATSTSNEGTTGTTKLLKKFTLLQQEYLSKTNDVVEKMKTLKSHERVSSFVSGLRADRYAVVKKIYCALYEDEMIKRIVVDELKLHITVVNLSLDYDEHNGYISLTELKETADIVHSFILNSHDGL